MKPEFLSSLRNCLRPGCYSSVLPEHLKIFDIRKIAVLASLCFSLSSTFAQTCTIAGSGTINWNNASPPACQNGISFNSATVLVIPTGVNLVFDSNGDTWSGTRIEVYGTLTIDFDVRIDASLVVQNNGLVNISKKLDIGTTMPSGSSCPYTVIINSGGKIDVDGTGTDRLNICGKPILKGSGSCNDCGGTNSGTCAYNNQPYCEPANGFQGPLGYSESGYSGALPITLSKYTVTLNSNGVSLFWATTFENNFSHFLIQRSSNALQYDDIGLVAGAGRDLFNTENKYSFEDQNPLAGWNYYRLKAVDRDGSFEYFGPKAIKIDGVRALRVFPNPSSGEAVVFQTNFNPSENDQVVILNQLGVEVFRAPAFLVQNNIEFSPMLRPGLYIVKYYASEFELLSKLVVKE
jgi:hypothetical protein